LDFDAAEREQTQRILALFQEKEARDELGFGGIRDSISDQLFPGTSTIQTRLRYMLFVAWMYRSLEEKRVPSAEIAAKARKFELGLTAPLLESDDRAGVFGRLAGGGLKRLPSSVYWAGLGAWGIRKFRGSQDEYHRALDAVYRRRTLYKGGGGEGEPDASQITWDPGLIDDPPNFPLNLSFEISREEADYLQDRIALSQGSTLIGYLAVHGKPAAAEFPWEHSQLASFRPEHRELLEHARLFSDVMHGAALVYNVLLSELRGRKDWVSKHRDLLSEWEDTVDRAVATTWEMRRFWELVRGHGYTIGMPTQSFVERWVKFVVSGENKFADRAEIRDLVRSREQSLKRAKSRFLNQRVLDQWGGEAGMTRLSFRWPIASRLLNDLYTGLKAGAHA
jgi:hypothetical protein